ncbi:MAG: hypothetical protein ACE5KA_07160 [Nitrososphaerales archaeon]
MIASKDKTYPMTFRLPETLIADLKKEAEDAQVSLNTLIKQVIDRHVSWERYSEKMGLVPLTRPFLKDVLKQLSDEKIKEIANNSSKDALRELTLLAKGTYDLASFISIFNEWLRASWMTHRYESTAEGHEYVIYHNLGRKWSLYLVELLDAVISDLVHTRPVVDIRKDSISFSIKKTELES